MNKKELSEAVKIAQSGEDLSTSGIDCFFGFGLPDFKSLAVTIKQIARLIRWQCFMFNGEMDMEALNEIRDTGRKKFLIVG